MKPIQIHRGPPVFHAAVDAQLVPVVDGPLEPVNHGRARRGGCEKRHAVGRNLRRSQVLTQGVEHPEISADAVLLAPCQ